jgi:hypothetical protein
LGSSGHRSKRVAPGADEPWSPHPRANGRWRRERTNPRVLWHGKARGTRDRSREQIVEPLPQACARDPAPRPFEQLLRRPGHLPQTLLASSRSNAVGSVNRSSIEHIVPLPPTRALVSR